MKKGLGVLLSIMLLCTAFTSYAEEENIKISEKEYGIVLNDAGNLFVSNDKAVNGEIGSKVFLTYTVEEVTKNTAFQNGVIAAENNEAAYPYNDKDSDGNLKSKGSLRCVNNKSLLFDEGYTYVFRFERTAKGFEYECARLKDDEAVSVEFGNTHGAEDGNFKYFGFWIGAKQEEGVKATLTHVRCYDENGNDLGIHFNGSSGMEQGKMNSLLNAHFTVNHNYSLNLEEQHSIAISNKYAARTDVVYMEYEVGQVTKDETYQEGIIATNFPQVSYPHSNSAGGLLQYKSYDKGSGATPLLKPGAKYFVCFAKNDTGFDGIVQCTLNGVTDTFAFAGKAGTYDPDYKYFSLWFGESDKSLVSCEIRNMKIYDSEGNNLGVQINKKDVVISHEGELENYSKSEAVYYCRDKQTMIALEEGQKVWKNTEGVMESGSYTISDADLILSLEEGKEIYKYEKLYLTDEEENQYQRLKTSKVTFVTGDETIVEKATAENGYRVSEPTKPQKEGNVFKGWFLHNGTAYDFDDVVTESITLYAKWQDGDGNEYLALEQETEAHDYSGWIAGILSAVIVAGCAAGCVVMVKRRSRHG